MEKVLHLAQLNVGKLLHPKGDPRMAGFFDNLDRINAIAERVPGFVWRLKDDSGNATDMRPFAEDPDMLLNMSVWESIEALEKFVWQTAHVTIYRKKPQYFVPDDGVHFVMWWIDAGHIPTPREAKERLDHLALNGPSDFAFDWKSTLQAKLWQKARCA